MAVTKQHPKLIEGLWSGWSAGENAAGRSQVCIAASNGVGAETIVHKGCAGIDATLLEIVIDVPLGLGSIGGLESQS